MIRLNEFQLSLFPIALDRALFYFILAFVLVFLGFSVGKHDSQHI